MSFVLFPERMATKLFLEKNVNTDITCNLNYTTKRSIALYEC